MLRLYKTVGTPEGYEDLGILEPLELFRIMCNVSFKRNSVTNLAEETLLGLVQELQRLNIQEQD